MNCCFRNHLPNECPYTFCVSQLTHNQCKKKDEKKGAQIIEDVSEKISLQIPQRFDIFSSNAMKFICLSVASVSKFVLVPQYLHNQFSQVCMNSLFLLDSNLKLLHSYSDKESKTADIIKLLRRLDYGKYNLNFRKQNKQTESFFFLLML